MIHCAINGHLYEPPVGLQTWEDLLCALEQGTGGDRPVVTAVRFGGVDQPSFRESFVLSQDINTITPIDVEASPARQLVTEAVETALNDIAPLLEAIQSTADAFRSHDVADAQSRLGEVVTTLQALTQLTAMVVQADLSPDKASASQHSSALLERVGRCLDSLVVAATFEDWITVADILEYDIAELLPEWVAVLRSVANAEANQVPSRS